MGKPAYDLGHVQENEANVQKTFLHTHVNCGIMNNGEESAYMPINK